MKKFSIDPTVVENTGYTLADIFLLLLIKECGNKAIKMDDFINDRLEQKIIRKNDAGYYGFSIAAYEALDEIITLSDKETPKSNDLEELALQMMDLFPKGKKPGTQYYWRGNKKEITLKLQKFMLLYGKDISHEDILKATENYVKSFSANTDYMRLLKYFILKQDKYATEDGGITQISELATQLENMGQEYEEPANQDWTATLI